MYPRPLFEWALGAIRLLSRIGDTKLSYLNDLRIVFVSFAFG